jgi:ribosomal protein S18 acetylase RimI-like enzyme
MQHMSFAPRKNGETLGYALGSEVLFIRPMRADDVREVVTTHLESFPGFFLSFLGPEFLTLLYRSVHASPEGVALVAVQNGVIEGFAAGVTQQEGFYRRLIRREKWKFAKAAAGAVLRRPNIVLRLCKALKYSDTAKQSAAPACLMSIAVRPHASGAGIGRTLVKAFCERIAERGGQSVCLTTDRDNNERTNRFYSQLGFHLARSFVTREGRAMNEYVMPLK